MCTIRGSFFYEMSDCKHIISRLFTCFSPPQTEKRGFKILNFKFYIKYSILLAVESFLKPIQDHLTWFLEKNEKQHRNGILDIQWILSLDDIVHE